MIEEGNIMRSIMLKLGKFPGVRLFRNNVGVAWIGKSKQFNSREMVNVESGDVLIQNGRVLHAGLCVGSSDLIGFRTLQVTPEMVGSTVAIFMAVEVKTKTGRASKEQISFVNMVNGFGGIAFIAKDEDEALALMNSKL